MKIEFFGTGDGGSETISLTTNNTSGASTLSSEGALNIPIYSDTNLNIGNTNLLSSDASRTFKVAGGGNLKLQTNAGLNTLEVNDSNVVLIGNTNFYSLPNERGTIGQILYNDNGTGNVQFGTLNLASTSTSTTTISNVTKSFNVNGNGYFLGEVLAGETYFLSRDARGSNTLTLVNPVGLSFRTLCKLLPATIDVGALASPLVLKDLVVKTYNNANVKTFARVVLWNVDMDDGENPDALTLRNAPIYLGNVNGGSTPKPIQNLTIDLSSIIVSPTSQIFIGLEIFVGVASATFGFSTSTFGQTITATTTTTTTTTPTIA
jgi:hypothetical protein